MKNFEITVSLTFNIIYLYWSNSYILIYLDLINPDTNN